MKINHLMKTLLLILVTSTASFAFADSNVAIKSSAMVEKVQKDANGKEIKTLEAATSVVPGQEVIFKNGINNKSNLPAKDIVVTNPIPEYMIFTSAYGTPDITITYSVDGKIFTSPDKLIIKDSVTGNNRVARPEEYKLVRWTLLKALEPNSSIEIGYKATLK